MLRMGLEKLELVLNFDAPTNTRGQTFREDVNTFLRYVATSLAE